MTEFFSHDEIKMLEEIEHLMDRGQLPFVMFEGRRVAVNRPCTEAFDLEQGQSINSVIFVEILHWQVRTLRAQIEEQKFNECPRS